MEEGERIGFYSLGINILLVGLKFGLAIFSGSIALVADAIHSLSDVVSSATDDFTCRAEGILEKMEGKGFQFTKIDLYPELTIGGDEEVEWAERVLEMSRKYCLVTNSMASEVTLNPMIHSKGK